MAAQAWVQLASVDTRDSSVCVIIGTRHERFMFNVGEGTQRLCMEHGIRVSKLEHTFFTHLCSDTLGGLPGLLLTLADVRAKAPNMHEGLSGAGSEATVGRRKEATLARSPEEAALTLHGPPELAEFYKATWHFVRREDFPVAVEAVAEDKNKKFRHEEINVTQIPILFPAHPEPQFPGASGGNPRVLPAAKQLGEEERIELPPPAKRARGDREFSSAGNGAHGVDGTGSRLGCVCYVCEAPALPGKFDLKKAVELGVPRGPSFGMLQKGHDVTLEDGTVIKPSQVLGPSRVGSSAIIVACPSAELLPSLVSHPDWERFYATVGGSGEGGGHQEPIPPPCVVHLAPEAVLRSREYGDWARRFGSGATHIVTTRPFCSQHSIFQAGHDQAARLNKVCDAAFALPRQFTEDASASGDGRKGSAEPRLIKPEELDFGGKVVSGVPLMKFELLQTSKRPQLDVSEALTWERSRSISKSMLQSLKVRPWASPSPPRQPRASGNAAAAPDDSEISFFGTGSAMPSKYRNVTGMLVRPLSLTPPAKEGEETAAAAAGGGGGSIMLDAGEGTLGQMWRVFGDGSEIRSGGADGDKNGDSSGGTTSGGSRGGSAICDGGGSRGTQHILRNLAAVWISHPHADHHLGLVRILSERNKLLGFGGGDGGGGGVLRGAGVAGSTGREGGAGAAGAKFPNLLLMGPAPVAAWLKEYGNIDPTVRGGYDFLDANLMQAGDGAPRPPPHVAAEAQRALSRAGILRATSVRVRHCAHAYALVLTMAAAAGAAKEAVEKSKEGGGGKGGDGWKLVYSGDCRPSEALVREGRNAAVLIHEATFDESKQQEAYAKEHCTIQEALRVGRRMCAERVILTHFSQRYPHMPTAIAGAANSNVSLAFDFMRVRVSDLSWLPRSYAAITAAVSPNADSQANEGLRSKTTTTTTTPDKKRSAPSSKRAAGSPLAFKFGGPFSTLGAVTSSEGSGSSGISDISKQSKTADDDRVGNNRRNKT